ncbi:MAG: hypothetical protein VB835_08000 [Pirellulales bacterium]
MPKLNNAATISGEAAESLGKPKGWLELKGQTELSAAAAAWSANLPEP